MEEKIKQIEEWLKESKKFIENAPCMDRVDENYGMIEAYEKVLLLLKSPQ